jgi:hypothetical protein
MCRFLFTEEVLWHAGNTKDKICTKDRSEESMKEEEKL